MSLMGELPWLALWCGGTYASARLGSRFSTSRNGLKQPFFGVGAGDDDRVVRVVRREYRDNWQLHAS
jgi:hypothetical protein